MLIISHPHWSPSQWRPFPTYPHPEPLSNLSLPWCNLQCPTSRNSRQRYLYGMFSMHSEEITQSNCLDLNLIIIIHFCLNYDIKVYLNFTICFNFKTDCEKIVETMIFVTLIYCRNQFTNTTTQQMCICSANPHYHHIYMDVLSHTEGLFKIFIYE